MGLKTRKKLRYARYNGPSHIFRRLPWALKFCRWLLARKKKIVVVGGHNGQCFDDNSRAVVLHYAKEPDVKVFWVRHPLSNYKIENLGVFELYQDSFKTELIVAIAHLIFYSHGTKDVSSADHITAPWKRVVFLGHGVWGLKRVERRDLHQRAREFDYTITVSPEEGELKSNVLGCPVENVLTVGLPKHDALLRRSRKIIEPREAATVLYMPTWRDWLQYKPSDQALKLHFGAFKKLVERMPEEDATGRKLNLIYILHKNNISLDGYARAVVKGKNIKLINSQEADLNYLLADVDYLITDYSSVFWDFILQNRAATLYQFDRSIYDSLTGNYKEMVSLLNPLIHKAPEDVWSSLFDVNVIDEIRKVSLKRLPFSDGQSCQKLSKVLNEDLKKF